MKKKGIGFAVLLLLLCDLNLSAKVIGRDFYFSEVEPGAVSLTQTGSEVSLQNNLVICNLSKSSTGWRLEVFNRVDSNSKYTDSRFFEYNILGRGRISSSSLIACEDYSVIELSPVKSSVLENSYSGKGVSIRFKDKFKAFEVEVRFLLRDGSNYLVKEVDFFPIKKKKVLSSSIWTAIPSVFVESGSVLGSPLESESFFLASEHPFSRIDNSRMGQNLVVNRGSCLKAGQKLSESGVIGAFVKGQERRSFQHYLQRRRARPYKQFLHYNSWYDIAWYERPFSDKECIDVIKAWQEKFIIPYGIKFDSFALDDGWDDYDNLWQFHPERFKDGFSPLNNLARATGSGIGVWISPAGGYLGEQQKRLKAGKKLGLAQDRAGFLMSDQSYYDYFRKVCLNLVNNYQVNYFKFDRLAGSFDENKQLEDKEAVLNLAKDLKTANPDVFINITIGTWPSPFWLRYCDSIWRGGDGDVAMRGKGNNNQKWLNFRDGATYTSIESRAKYYPLNSLMLHGIVCADLGLAKDLDGNIEDWKNQVKSYFCSGANLQELYVNHRLLTNKHWEILGEWANWARANESVLADTHWLGGNPFEHSVYGWCSWNGDKGIICLRNSDDKKNKISVSLSEILELADFETGDYSLTEMDFLAKPIGNSLEVLNSGKNMDFELDGFEVRVYEVQKVQKSDLI
ncbi:MAG: hypothetical protein JXR63_00035 [Spirochaetales bacterium]|nr:hypothetical protein [Spirochaetales bacterium]